MALATLFDLHMMLQVRNVDQVQLLVFLIPHSIRQGSPGSSRQVYAYNSCWLCRVSCYHSFTSHHFSQFGHLELPLCGVVKKLGLFTWWTVSKAEWFKKGGKNKNKRKSQISWYAEFQTLVHLESLKYSLLLNVLHKVESNSEGTMWATFVWPQIKECKQPQQLEKAEEEALL